MDSDPASFTLLVASSINLLVVVNSIGLIFLLICSALISGTEVAFFSLPQTILVEESEKTNVVCDEINPNQFIYILIKNKSTKKMKSRLGMYSYEKFYLDVQIDIFEIKTLNKSAHYICSNIINRTAERNINDIIKLFQ